MKADEKRRILAEHMAKLRARGYSDLIAQIGNHGHLDMVEGTADDGSAYYMDFDIYWDDYTGGNVRVMGYFWHDCKPLLGFLPIYGPEDSDCFIMRRDGTVVDEDD